MRRKATVQKRTYWKYSILDMHERNVNNQWNELNAFKLFSQEKHTVIVNDLIRIEDVLMKKNRFK